MFIGRKEWKYMNICSPQARFRINSSAKDYLISLNVFLSGSYCQGDFCHRLEQEVSLLVNTNFAIAMPQARVGLYFAISAIARPGQEVILSPNTIADVINMVICAGAVPVFCDIEPATGNLDPSLVENLITRNTVAILATHLYGLIAPMDQLGKIARKHNLLLIEDAAQAFGARKNCQYAGTMGDIGVYSFGMAKNVMAFFGGMLVTPHEHIEKAVRQKLEAFPLMDKGKLGKKIFSCLIKDIASYDCIFSLFLFRLFRFGYRNNIKAITSLIETELDLTGKSELPEIYKEKMTPLQAKLVLAKLQKVEPDFQHRLACARIYHESLKDIPELILPPMRDDGSHVYNYYPIGFKDRIALRMFLMTHDRDVALQHIKNTADLPTFKKYYRDCPEARLWAKQTIMMPNYVKYCLKEVQKNSATLRAFFGK